MPATASASLRDGGALLRLARALPKAELHAHLSGSIRPSLLLEWLAAEQRLTAADAALLAAPLEERALADCFRIFAIIHSAVTTTERLCRVLADAVDDYAAENTRYLELRTTPRTLASSFAVGPWARELLEADAELGPFCAALVLALAALECRRGGGNAAARACTVRILLSLNRTESVAKARATLRLAQLLARFTVPASALPEAPACCRGDDSSAFADAVRARGAAVFGPFVVGIDVSGDPTRGDVLELLPVLRDARASGLKISIHAGEVLNDAETDALVAFRPDRLGHMCSLGPATLARLVSPEGNSARLPVETCPTSNSLTLALGARLHEHPTLGVLLAAGHPLAVCADDRGVFGVSLSHELAATANAFALSREALAELALAAFDVAFVGDGERAALRADAEQAVAKLRDSESGAL